MSETIRLILTKFTDETIVIFSLLLLMTMMGIIIYWFYNRKKFHQLSHEIPASVVKNYLDSIIQNSNSLKSSLFRGGGLDMGNGIPSVVPLGDLPTSKVHSVGVAGEEASQKNAEIAALTLKLNDRFLQIQDLEKTIQDLAANKGLGAESEMLKKDLLNANIRIKDLEERLKNVAPSDGVGSVSTSAELESVTNERDELLERLKEYAVIEQDLANLKRLQQENEELKATVDELKKLLKDESYSSDEVLINEPDSEPEADMDDMDDMDDLEAAMAQAIAESEMGTKQEEISVAAEGTQELEIKGGDLAQDEGESKSGEELLSEFEKMLG